MTCHKFEDCEDCVNLDNDPSACDDCEYGGDGFYPTEFEPYDSASQDEVLESEEISIGELESLSNRIIWMHAA